ncbi:hypothetical protein QCA50_014040 [Cerrena zonata]|uniref:Cytochrome b5 heme-binding domain-containing protein n=1 Tax=Cerrena zonata TaxID=2478898 RepID=A0AAW0G0C5_9APHY
MSRKHTLKDSLFGIIDIVRVIGGLLLLNAFLSWWFTSSSTWGYKELALYNGTDQNLPIYLAINGKVYDVTNGRAFYGPPATYSSFSGKDSARAFVTGCIKSPEQYTHDLRGIEPTKAAKHIADWQKYYDESDKYWYVGTVHHEELTGEPPAPCKGAPYPGMTSDF